LFSLRDKIQLGLFSRISVWSIEYKRTELNIEFSS